MKKQPSLVTFFETHEKAEAAIIKLQKSGFDMKMLSIVGTDYHTDETVTGYYSVGDRIKKWGSLGAFWGGFWGLLLGSAFFIIPGIGPLLIAGPLVCAIVGALEGATVAGGIGVLGAALISLGIPKTQVLKYETEVKAGKFMLLAHGTADEIEKARNTLGLHLPKENTPKALEEIILSGGERSFAQ